MKGEYGLTPRDQSQLFQNRGNLESTLDRYFNTRRLMSSRGQDVSHYDVIIPREMGVFKQQQERLRITEIEQARKKQQEQEEFDRLNPNRMEDLKKAVDEYIAWNKRKERMEEAKAELWRRFPRDAWKLLSKHEPDEALKLAEEQEIDRKRVEVEMEQRMKEAEDSRTKEAAMKKAVADLSNIFEYKFDIAEKKEGKNEEKGMPQDATGLSKHLINIAARKLTSKEVQELRKEYWTAEGNKGKQSRSDRKGGAHPASVSSLAKKYGISYQSTNGIIVRKVYYDLPLAEGEPEENLKKLNTTEYKVQARAKKLGLETIIGKGGRIALKPEDATRLQQQKMEQKKLRAKAKAEADPEAFKAKNEAMVAKIKATKAANKAKKEEATRAAGQSNAAAGAGGY